MAVELKIPEAGESIRRVQIGVWLKKPGQFVRRDENVVEIETDKATMELPAPTSGVLSRILKREGEFAEVGEVIAYIDEAAAPAGDGQPPEQPAADREPPTRRPARAEHPGAQPAPPAPAAPTPAQQPSAAPAQPVAQEPPPKRFGAFETSAPTPASQRHVMPAARRMLAEHALHPEQVASSGPGGRLLKEDVLRHLERQPTAPAPSAAPVETPPAAAAPSAPEPMAPVAARALEPGQREEELVPLTPLRMRIAERLVEAQQTAALLTTFNEIDMSAVMALRNEYREAFEKKYGVRLGIMSFFVKASIEALKQFPQVNAELRCLDGGRTPTHVLYRNYYDIGIAVSAGKGLVVPVLRNAERMSFAEIELAIADFAARGRENRIRLEELQGGTFTISNGGVFGSLLSTPIVNPPQSGILGLHAIQDRPVVRDGQIVVRPMMYVALTYDHRIIDGREAVTFLRRIKECVENPARMLIEV